MSEEKLDKIVRHNAYMKSQGTRIYNDLLELLDDLEADVIKKIKASENLKPPEFLEALLREIDSAISAVYSNYESNLAEQLVELGLYESEYAAAAAANLGASNVVQLSEAQLLAIVRENPIDGKLLNEWFKEQEDGVKMKVRQQLRLGIGQGETTRQLANRLEDTGFKKARHHINTLVRTASHSVNTAAGVDTYKASGVKKVQLSAVLDSRTTLECAKLDGRVYDIDDPKRPRPPLHPGCRLDVIPVIDGQKFEGNYKEWFARQTEKEKREYLGPARYKLYKEGMSIDEFTDSNGRVIPLAELKKLDKK